MPDRPRPVTVLMADDDPDDRALARDAFAESWPGVDLRFVEDGERLMDYLYRRGRFEDPAASPRPGVILLDLNMPRKDGREALREISAERQFRGIRVVVFSTSRAEADVADSYALSAASFITKPASFAGLREVVRTLGKYWFEVVELLPDGYGTPAP